jgi:hypothetical protein
MIGIGHYRHPRHGRLGFLEQVDALGRKLEPRTHFAHRIDLWDDDGENIIEHLAGVEDLQVALATYRAACERWPKAPITLRQGLRVIKDSRRRRLA